MEKAKTKVEIRGLEGKKAQLQLQPESEAACTNKEAKKRAAAATAAAMEENERKIQRGTSPGGSRVDMLRRFFNRDPVSGMKINLDAEDSVICLTLLESISWSPNMVYLWSNQWE